ncbi:MAG: Methanol-cobalamin methyltransferase subunit [Verrucomicrobiota bacterium]
MGDGAIEPVLIGGRVSGELASGFAGERMVRVSAGGLAAVVRAHPLMRGLAVVSAGFFPQALVIAPESAVAIAGSVVGVGDAYGAARASARTGIGLIREAYGAGWLRLASRELPWLDRRERVLDGLPEREADFIAEMLGEVDTSRFVAGDYEQG